MTDYMLFPMTSKLSSQIKDLRIINSFRESGCFIKQVKCVPGRPFLPCWLLHGYTRVLGVGRMKLWMAPKPHSSLH
jgi:hypothetical protein